MADQDLIADAGGHFAVELEEPAGAGYRWAPAALPSGLLFEGDQLTPGESGQGGSRRRVFRFVASDTGRFQVDFELKRPWEEKAADVCHVRVTHQ